MLTDSLVNKCLPDATKSTSLKDVAGTRTCGVPLPRAKPMLSPGDRRFAAAHTAPFPRNTAL
ncbi:MAG TPA: hypothetical protein VMJ32_10510 [Pirellulales bacterium]|nr:hypothetical protein [Pirellulales bacterium]